MALKVKVPRELVELFGSEEEALKEALRLAELVYLPLIRKLALIKKVIEGIEGETDVTALEDEGEIIRCLKEIRKKIYEKWVSE